MENSSYSSTSQHHLTVPYCLMCPCKGAFKCYRRPWAVQNRLHGYEWLASNHLSAINHNKVAHTHTHTCERTWVKRKSNVDGLRFFVVWFAFHSLFKQERVSTCSTFSSCILIPFGCVHKCNFHTCFAYPAPGWHLTRIYTRLYLTVRGPMLRVMLELTIVGTTYMRTVWSTVGGSLFLCLRRECSGSCSETFKGKRCSKAETVDVFQDVCGDRLKRVWRATFERVTESNHSFWRRDLIHESEVSDIVVESFYERHIDIVQA